MIVEIHNKIESTGKAKIKQDVKTQISSTLTESATT